jgi:hypothetical protein
MYTVELNSEQIQVLKDVLECSLSELHTEIHHTDSRCFREQLRERESLMQDLLQMLASLELPVVA